MLSRRHPRHPAVLVWGSDLATGHGTSKEPSTSEEPVTVCKETATEFRYW